MIEFIVGNSYKVELQDNEYPILDSSGNDTGNNEIIKENSMRFEVLELLKGDHKNFISVFNIGSSKEQLFYVQNAIKLTPISFSPLKKDYKAPVVPKGFAQLCAFHYTDGDVMLDFISHDRKDFATESMEVNIEWPWIDGYKAKEEAWESIGFCPLYA